MKSVTRRCSRVEKRHGWTWCGVPLPVAYEVMFEGCVKSAPESEAFDVPDPPLVLVTPQEDLFVVGRLYRIEVSEVREG